MSETTKISISETNIDEALTLLYIKSLDLSGKTPEEIVHIYYDAKKRVSAEHKKIVNENKVKRQPAVF